MNNTPTMDLGSPRYLTVREVAELLGFHPETIKRWAREDKIDYLQAGHYGHLRVRWPLKKPTPWTKNNKERRMGY